MYIKNIPFRCYLVFHQLIIPQIFIHCTTDLFVVPSFRLSETMLLRTFLYMCFGKHMCILLGHLLRSGVGGSQDTHILNLSRSCQASKLVVPMYTLQARYQTSEALYPGRHLLLSVFQNFSHLGR